jgi:hypothetical protein
MLFPNLGPSYFDEKDKDILLRMETFYNQALTINLAYWGEADTDYRFYAGDQSLWNEIYGNLPFSSNRSFNFNRIRRVVDMVSGYQRRNRKSTAVIPIENADQDTADQFTEMMMWLDRQENIGDTISRAFNGALVSGMSLMQVWMDYRADPINGNIRVSEHAYNTFMCDPFFRNPDMSDCNGVWKRSYISKREAISLLPAKSDEIIGMYGNDNRDGKFQFMPESYNYGQTNLLTYDEFYYKDYRNQRLLIDTVTGESIEWKGKSEEDLKLFLFQYPQIKVIKQEVPTVKLAIVVNGKVLYDGPQPLGIDAYPFVPVFAYYYPEIPYYNWRIQGMVRGLRDSQYLYNRRKIIELDIMESQINSGWKLKENALVNFDDAFLSGQGKPFVIKEEAQMSDVEKILPADIPPSMIQLSQLLGEEISQISGVNEELLGSAVDDKAGVLAMMRQGAGLTTLQKLFDQLDHSQKLLGKILVQIIQNNFTPGKVKRILNKEPSKQFYDKTFGRYDCAIEEGYNTTTQKQMQFAQMLQLREAGVPIPPAALLEASTLQKKNELVKAIAQQEQQQSQLAQAQLQQQIQLQQAEINLANSTASANESLGIERISRVNENQALALERKAQASRDEMSGLLDLTKALKEIESIDIASLEKLITLGRMVKEAEEKKPVEPGLQVPQPNLSPVQPQQAPETPEIPQGSLGSQLPTGVA